MKTGYDKTFKPSNGYLRKITLLFYLSGALNIALLISLGYLLVHETQNVVVYEKKPVALPLKVVPLAASPFLAKTLLDYRKLSFTNKLQLLNDVSEIELGYKKRDAALSLLVKYHDFDLARALGKNEVLPKKWLVIGQKKGGQNEMVPLYAVLTDQEAERIIDFARLEKWPLTARGLLKALKLREKSLENDDSKSLIIALQHVIDP